MKVKAKDDIFNFLEKNKTDIQKFGVKRLGVFGSFVKNTQRDHSDIDFLVEFYSNKVSYTNFIELAYFLEDNLQTKIDLITLESLSPHIGPHILKEVEYASF